MINFYQNKNKSIKKRVLSAVKGPLLKLFVYLSCGTALSLFLNKSYINNEIYSVNLSELYLSDAQQIIIPDNNMIKQVYMYDNPTIIAFCFPLILISTIFFITYGASALAYYPLSLIFKFLDRPSKPEPETHVLAKRALIRKSE